MYSRTLSGFLLLIGVILPVAALVFELLTGGCAGLLFDPIPNWLHVLAVAYVPIANFILLKRLWHNPVGELTPWMQGMNTATLVISGVYTLAFLPVTHAAVIGILFFGIGLLPLAPLGALTTALLLGKRMRNWRKLEDAQPAVTSSRPIWIGLLAAFALLGVAEIPRWATIVGVELTESYKPTKRVLGLKMLRVLGNQEVLLGACYGRGGMYYEILEPDISQEAARKLYYQVTGVSFNEVEHDELVDFSLRETRGQWDADLGGEEVGQILPEVKLTSSRLDGVLYPESRVGYVEWTMVFHNDGRQSREARFILRPPPGGVTSRVTLWVNGEPREAAFGKTAQVREAYQQVAVRQRRDPLLVTAQGMDTNLVQCFPILPNSDMKIRIGMSFPLQDWEWEDVQAAPLPEILDRNFLLSPGLAHSLWYEGPGELTLLGESTVSAERDLKASLSDEELTGILGVATDLGATKADVAKSPFDEMAYRVESQRHVAGDDIYLVVNGSAGMRDSSAGLAERLSTKRQVEIWFAGDVVEHFSGTGSEAEKWLLKQRYVGGRDSLPALVDAVNAVSAMRESADKTIWWVDAGQPVILDNPDKLEQLYERRDPGVAIVYCPVGDRVNRLRQSPPLAYAPTASPSNFAWQSQRLVDLAEGVAMPQGGGPEHLYRVVVANELRSWLEELYRQQGTLKPTDYQDRLNMKATQIATAQLVTPITGAVVLETQAQYDANDLEPADPNTVPNVPEPEQAALVIGALIALALLGRRHWRRRRA